MRARFNIYFNSLGNIRFYTDLSVFLKKKNSTNVAMRYRFLVSRPELVLAPTSLNKKPDVLKHKKKRTNIACTEHKRKSFAFS